MITKAERDRPTIALPEEIKRLRMELRSWVADFLWELGGDDNEMGEGDAAEIILSTLESHLPISDSARWSPPASPKVLFEEWKSRQGEI